jgi:CRISPR type IV-associated protein Csf3
MKMIWAVVRSDKVEPIARQLKGIGVSGCTVYPVRGYGEQWHLYEPLILGGHYKLEVIVEEDHVEKVVDEITEWGSTGQEGDGVLSVLDIASVVQIRSKKRREMR